MTSETTNPAVYNISSPRALSHHSHTNSSRRQNVTSSRNQHHDSPNLIDDIQPNVENLYQDEGHSALNIDPNAPVLSGAVGEDTLREIEQQNERKEQDRREKEAVKADLGGGNRFVGGFVLGLKNALRPRWGSGGRAQQTPRDPFPAFPHAVYAPEPDDDDYDDSQYDREHDREHDHDPADVEYHAGGDRGKEYRRRTSYQSLEPPSETVHPTTEWHDDGTTAVDHTMHTYNTHGNIPPRIPQNVPPYPSSLPSRYSQPRSNYIPANNGVYDYSTGSPVLVEIEPAVDYAKMDMPASTVSEASFNTYLTRIRHAVEHFSSLPWVAERVTADYYPAGIRSEKIERRSKEKERLKKQDEEKLGPGGLFGDGGQIGRRDRRPIMSWYDRHRMGVSTVNHEDIDLTAGSPPPVQMTTSNAGVTIPYSPLAPTIVPSSSFGTGMALRPGDVPLAPGIRPNPNPDINATLVPPATVDPNTPNYQAAGAPVEMSTRFSPPVVTVLPHPTSVHHRLDHNFPPAWANDPTGQPPQASTTQDSGVGSVSINVVPPSTSASAPSAVSTAPLSHTAPVVRPPSILIPPTSHSPPRSTTHSHTRSPSVPVMPIPNMPSHSHTRSPSVPGPFPVPAAPSQTYTRTPSITHTQTPSVSGGRGYIPGRRPRNPNTPIRHFPATNVPVTSAPPRTPVPTAPPTPANAHHLNVIPGLSSDIGTAPVIPSPTPMSIRQFSQSAQSMRSEGGRSDRSGKSGVSGISAKTGRSGRSFVVVNGAATPSSSTTGEMTESRRETLEASVTTPVSARPSTQYETPVVSTYAGDESHEYIDRKGKGRAPPPTVWTVSDAGSVDSRNNADYGIYGGFRAYKGQRLKRQP